MAQVLIVDDERFVLDAFRRTLRSRYDLLTAGSGPEALELLGAAGPPDREVAVIVSDMMMPGMNGATFLGQARLVAPDAVQMILSGQADLASTVAAVNNGNLFRFLTKPCQPEELCKALDDALRQHQLLTAERTLLERTLQGAVEVLTEVLSLTSPLAFSRSRVLSDLVEGATERLGTPPDWQLRLAALLSQVGCVAIPPHVLEQAAEGSFRSAEEERTYAGHPRLARALLQRIPRLETVAQWVGDQPLDPDEELGPPPSGAAAVFSAAASFLLRCERGRAPREAVRELEAAGYPLELLEALLAASTPARSETTHELLAHQVNEGMVLDQDVLTTTGMVLVRRGERVTETLAARLGNFARTVGVVEPIRVITVSAP
jgi:CheY-like chemotaxis protein